MGISIPHQHPDFLVSTEQEALGSVTSPTRTSSHPTCPSPRAFHDHTNSSPFPFPSSGGHPSQPILKLSSWVSAFGLWSPWHFLLPPAFASWVLLLKLFFLLFAANQVTSLLGSLHSCKAPALAVISEIQICWSTDENLPSEIPSTEKEDTFLGERG